jgi:hypothetical protein
MKKAVMSVASAIAVRYILAALRRGKAMRREPICAGKMRLPKPDCGATVSTKKSMIVPCIVTRARYSSGRMRPWSGKRHAGYVRCRRMRSERMVPRMTATAEMAM